MNKAFSVYLDFLRGVAAILVVFYHYSNQVANGSWAHTFPAIGQEAVIIFFVLSGYVITYAAENREKSAIEFFCKRFSRVYSVFIPSLLFALLCWYLVQALGKVDVYEGRTTFGHPFAVSIINLSFLNFNTFLPRLVPPGGGLIGA